MEPSDAIFHAWRGLTKKKYTNSGWWELSTHFFIMLMLLFGGRKIAMKGFHNDLQKISTDNWLFKHVINMEERWKF